MKSLGSVGLWSAEAQASDQDRSRAGCCKERKSVALKLSLSLKT